MPEGGGWGGEGPLTLYSPPREDTPRRGAGGRAGGGGSSTPAPPGLGTRVQVSRLWGEELELMTDTATRARIFSFTGKPAPMKQRRGVGDRRLTVFQKKGWRSTESGCRSPETSACATRTFPGPRAPPRARPPGRLPGTFLL